jgi:hypothetical protein
MLLATSFFAWVLTPKKQEPVNVRLNTEAVPVPQTSPEPNRLKDLSYGLVGAMDDSAVTSIIIQERTVGNVRQRLAKAINDLRWELGNGTPEAIELKRYRVNRLLIALNAMGKQSPIIYPEDNATQAIGSIEKYLIEVRQDGQ